MTNSLLSAYAILAVNILVDEENRAQSRRQRRRIHIPVRSSVTPHHNDCPTGVYFFFTIDFTVTFTVAPTGWKKSGTFSTPLDGKNPAQNDFCPRGVENVPDFVHPTGWNKDVMLRIVSIQISSRGVDEKSNMTMDRFRNIFEELTSDSSTE